MLLPRTPGRNTTKQQRDMNESQYITLIYELTLPGLQRSIHVEQDVASLVVDRERDGCELVDQAPGQEYLDRAPCAGAGHERHTVLVHQIYGGLAVLNAGLGRESAHEFQNALL